VSETLWFIHLRAQEGDDTDDVVFVLLFVVVVVVADDLLPYRRRPYLAKTLFTDGTLRIPIRLHDLV